MRRPARTIGPVQGAEAGTVWRRRAAAYAAMLAAAHLASWADRVVFLRDGRVVDQTLPASGPESLVDETVALPGPELLLLTR